MNFIEQTETAFLNYGEQLKTQLELILGQTSTEECNQLRQ